MSHSIHFLHSKITLKLKRRKKMSEEKDWSDTSFEDEKRIEKFESETPQETEKKMEEQKWVNGGFLEYPKPSLEPGLTIREPPPPPPAPSPPPSPVEPPYTPPQ